MENVETEIDKILVFYNAKKFQERKVDRAEDPEALINDMEDQDYIKFYKDPEEAEKEVDDEEFEDLEF